MTMTALEALKILSTLATEVQSSGLVPSGTPLQLVSILTTGLTTALNSGMLNGSTPIAIEDIGQDFEAAMKRMREELSRT